MRTSIQFCSRASPRIFPGNVEAGRQEREIRMATIADATRRRRGNWGNALKGESPMAVLLLSAIAALAQSTAAPALTYISGSSVKLESPLPLQASATLVLSPDGITVYDTVNNVSWLADADLAATNRFGLPVCTGSGAQPCVNASGSMSYQAAAAWVAAMNAANYLGHTNWQLPTTPLTDSGCPFTGPNGISFGFNCSASALGSLYYNALGLKAPNTAVPI